MTLDFTGSCARHGGCGEAAALPVAGWSVDTRTQQPGDVYFALRGANRDGHDFVPQALARGAAAVVVEAAWNAGPDGKRCAWRTRWWRSRNWSVGAAEVGRDGDRGDGQCGQDHYQGRDRAPARSARPGGADGGKSEQPHRRAAFDSAAADGARTAVLEMGMNHAGKFARSPAWRGPKSAWSQRRVRTRGILRFN